MLNVQILLNLQMRPLPGLKAKWTSEPNVDFPDGSLGASFGPLRGVSAAALRWVRLHPQSSSFWLSSAARASSTRSRSDVMAGPRRRVDQSVGRRQRTHGSSKTPHSWQILVISFMAFLTIYLQKSHQFFLVNFIISDVFHGVCLENIDDQMYIFNTDNFTPMLVFKNV